MEIKKELFDEKLVLFLTGRIDTVTSPVLESEINSEIDKIKELVLDFIGVSYISSACLRVLLSTQKIMNTKGKMSVINANDTVKEVFKITGFDKFINIV